MGNYYKITGKFLAIFLLGLLVSCTVGNKQVFAQTPTPFGHTCHWEYDCTPTPTGTLEGTVTSTPETPVPTSEFEEGFGFEAPSFPKPTGIPGISFGTPIPELDFTPVPAPSPLAITLTPWASPDYPTINLTPNPSVTLASISTTIDIPSFSTPMGINTPVTGTGGFSGTGALDDAIDDIGDFSGDLMGYTNSLTATTTAMQGSETITVVTAPAWYAPDLPRPLADVGYTFEIMTDPEANTANFTVSSWASFFGYIASLPFQFIKSLWQLVAYFGPFGLFLAWLFIMFLLLVTWYGVVSLIRLIIMGIRFIKQLIELIPGF